ncbi:hypothetical protein ACA910_015226 [Epithemia clementina (nom. ined.)]
MIKHEHECRLVNVEARLQQEEFATTTTVVVALEDHTKSSWCLSSSGGDDNHSHNTYDEYDDTTSTTQQQQHLPAIEIQFENLDSTITGSLDDDLPVPSTVFVTPDAGVDDPKNNKATAAAPSSADILMMVVPSPSKQARSGGFSLGELLLNGGSTTASTSQSIGTPSSSFFPDSWVMTSNHPKPNKELDEGSVMSTAYFDQSDFSPVNWADILTEQEVVLGLAVVYLTISLTHPLLFLAGALTALSTATAVGAGYDFLVEGPLAKCLCGHSLASSTTTTTTAAEAESLAAALENAIDSNSKPVSPLTIDDTEMEQDDENIEKQLEMGWSSDPVLSSLASSDVTTEKLVEANEASVNTVVMAPASTLNTMSTMSDFCLPEDWIASHYPPLDHPVIERHEFFGLNVNHFFQVFLADSAPYNYKEFQNRRGDKNIEYGGWQDVCIVKDEDEEEFMAPLSLHPEAALSFPRELEYNDFFQRTLTFQAKTNNAFLGPPFASTTKEQRMLVVNKRLGILETKTTFADIPFCDRFFVMDRWILTAEKGETDGNYRCQISTSCQVFFVKSCPFESQIRSKTKSSIKDVSTAWLHMATKALALSEQHKQEREQQQQQQQQQGLLFDDDDDDDDDNRRHKAASGKTTETKPDSAGENSDPTAILQTAPATTRAIEGENDVEPESIEVTEADVRRCAISATAVEGELPHQPKELRRRRTFSSISSTSSNLSSDHHNKGNNWTAPMSRLGRWLSPQRNRRSRDATSPPPVTQQLQQQQQEEQQSSLINSNAVYA